MQHTISVLVVNQSGVLSRISGLFSGRGFNIESLNVAETNEPGISRMTIVTRGDDKKIEQVTKQLNKLVDIIKVIDLTDELFVDRELILVKMNAEPRVREEILRIVDISLAPSSSQIGTRLLLCIIPIPSSLRSPEYCICGCLPVPTGILSPHLGCVGSGV